MKVTKADILRMQEKADTRTIEELFAATAPKNKTACPTCGGTGVVNVGRGHQGASLVDDDQREE